MSTKQAEVCPLLGRRRSVDRASLQRKLPANREFYREFRESYAIREIQSSKMTVPQRLIANLSTQASRENTFWIREFGDADQGISPIIR
jgi:hypothetical protein